MGDTISFWMVDLSIWIIMLIILVKTNQPTMFNKTIISLLLILMTTFYTWNFMLFFILFEMSMVVIVMTVMIWGYQPERIEATLFMIILTTIFSLPLFIALATNFSKLNFWFIKYTMKNLWEYLSFLIIFMVKMPVFFIHVWLPKVHVESPVHGSMILASIMLKLGCYGMIRLTKMTVKINYSLMYLITTFGIWTAVMLSMMCNIQSDLKSLVAYSSIVHMTMAFVSIMMMKSKSLFASITIMIGHGMCSSAMFFMCNQMYKISKSRSALINKGILSLGPTSKSLWFFICMLNAPMPPSINILGEMLTFKTIMTWNSWTIPAAFIVMLFSSCYSIVAFCIPSHGQLGKMVVNPKILNSKNLTITVMHILPAIFLITKSNMMMTY